MKCFLLDRKYLAMTPFFKKTNTSSLCVCTVEIPISLQDRYNKRFDCPNQTLNKKEGVMF
uniref:Uncharacterized protein n=1 Tax=Octopus bimaculoides TaxID=37653 RepID=A0A0L8FNV3_OCTBM